MASYSSYRRNSPHCEQLHQVRGFGKAAGKAAGAVASGASSLLDKGSLAAWNAVGKADLKAHNSVPKDFFDAIKKQKPYYFGGTAPIKIYEQEFVPQVSARESTRSGFGDKDWIFVNLQGFKDLPTAQQLADSWNYIPKEKEFRDLINSGAMLEPKYSHGVNYGFKLVPRASD